MARRKKDNDAASAISKFLNMVGINVEGKQSVGHIIKSSANNHFTVDDEQRRAHALAVEMRMAQERTYIEAESALFFIQTNGLDFKQKPCKECNQIFAATYYAVAYCSNLCRYKSLSKYGIVWNLYAKTDIERWGGRIPMVLGPEALKAAMEAVENDIANAVFEPEEEEPDVPEIGRLEEDEDIEYQEFMARGEDV